MSREQLNQEAGAKMDRAIQSFRAEMAKMRTGRASLSVLDDVRVEYYGQPTSLNAVATLGVPEPRLITITPWETKLIPEIERAIIKANLGLSPVNDGKMIRLPVPSLTEERRRELVKLLKKSAEDARVSIRHARREFIDGLKSLEKSGQLTEDELKKDQQTAQQMTDKAIEEVDQALGKKEAELMQV